jgi:hypothetical protein
MGMGGAEDGDNESQRGVEAGTHIQGLDRQPDRLDPDHSSSRNQAAHCAAADGGHCTPIVIVPRMSSMQIGSSDADGSAGSGSPTNVGVAARSSTVVAGNGTRGVGCSTATTQRRSRLAFSPSAGATAAIDTPGCRHAATTFALNPALCRRRRRGPASEASTCPPNR